MLSKLAILPGAGSDHQRTHRMMTMLAMVMMMMLVDDVGG
jgi:hypothetical protein